MRDVEWDSTPGRDHVGVRYPQYRDPYVLDGADSRISLYLTAVITVNNHITETADNANRNTYQKYDRIR